MDIDQPEPWRSPLPYHVPHVSMDGTDGPMTPPNAEVMVSFPNEDPDTEDDLTLNVKFTGEGIIVDLFVSDGEPVATFGQTYEEFVGTVHALDPANRTVVLGNLRPQDAPVQRVAALSADLRSIIEENDADEYGDSEAEANCARDLLDAIDAMLSEAGR